MIKELPSTARQCSINGVYITPDAKVYKTDKKGFKEVTIKADKKSIGKFYNSAEKKYYSLTQAYAEAFVPNGEQKPLAFIKDASKGLDPSNILWATNDEWREYWKAHAERKCKCCGNTVEKDMVGQLCKGCFTKMTNAKPDTDEIKRFQERVAATGFDPNTALFSGRQRDALELFCSGESMAKIASILGCDLKTANACIKSAKTARALERMTSQTVTPIGYKSSADVIPAKVTLNADGSEKRVPLASKDLKVTRASKAKHFWKKSEPLTDVYSPLEKPEEIEPEEITPDWYNQEAMLKQEKIPTPVSVEEDAHTIIGKLAKLLRCSLKTAIACFKLARKLESGEQDEPLTDSVPEADHALESSKNCRLATSKIDACTSVTDISASEEVASEPITVVDPVIVYVKVPVVKEVPVIKEVIKEITKEVPVVKEVIKEVPVTVQEEKKSSEVSKLHELYKTFGNTNVPFSSFCKVYWVACNYSKEYAYDFTKAAVAHLYESGLLFNTQNINNAMTTLVKVNHLI